MLLMKRDTQKFLERDRLIRTVEFARGFLCAAGTDVCLENQEQDRELIARIRKHVKQLEELRTFLEELE